MKLSVVMPEHTSISAVLADANSDLKDEGFGDDISVRGRIKKD